MSSIGLPVTFIFSKLLALSYSNRFRQVRSKTANICCIIYKCIVTGRQPYIYVTAIVLCPRRRKRRRIRRRRKRRSKVHSAL